MHFVKLICFEMMYLILNFPFLLGTVVGWGFDETGKVTEQLHKAQMPIVSQDNCRSSFPEFYSRFTSDRTFCAGFKNGKCKFITNI